MRTVTLITGMWLAAALPALAAPQQATPTSQASQAGATASHNRIGDIMGSLTRALREAAEQRQAQEQRATTARLDATDATTTAQASAAPLPADANAQAAVP